MSYTDLLTELSTIGLQFKREDKYRLHAERMQNKGNRIAYSYILTSIHEAAPVIAGSGFFLP